MIPLVEVIRSAGAWTVRVAFGRDSVHAINPDTEDAAWGCALYLLDHPRIAWAVFRDHLAARSV